MHYFRSPFPVDALRLDLDRCNPGLFLLIEGNPEPLSSLKEHIEGRTPLEILLCVDEIFTVGFSDKVPLLGPLALLAAIDTLPAVFGGTTLLPTPVLEVAPLV